MLILELVELDLKQKNGCKTWRTKHETECRTGEPVFSLILTERPDDLIGVRMSCESCGEYIKTDALDGFVLSLLRDPDKD